MKKCYLSASIMCGNMMNIKNEIINLEKAKVDYIHIDVMDLNYVNNLTFGSDFINQLMNITSIPFEIHYMVNYPSKIINLLEINKHDIIHVIHIDCLESIDDVFRLVNDRGDKFGLAISPDVKIESLHKYINIIDEVLVLSVIPGFAGQPFIEDSYDKVKKISDLLGSRDIILCVDGGMSVNRACRMKDNGANMFVGGTSGIYIKNSDFSENVKKYKEALTLKLQE